MLEKVDLIAGNLIKVNSNEHRCSHCNLKKKNEDFGFILVGKQNKIKWNISKYLKFKV